MKFQSLMFVGLVSFAACAHTTQPTGGSPQVMLLQARTPENCFELGPVDATAMGSFLYGDVLTEQAQRALQRSAAELGATHVRLLEMVPSAHESHAFGQAYRCAANPTLR